MASWYEEFAKRYEKPQVDDLIVGFSGIDPQRKGTGGGSGCECDSSTLTEAQRAIVRELIQEALSVIDFSKCDCDPTQLTETQSEIIRRLIEKEIEELELPECDCDPTSLNDEQQEIIRTLIDDRLKELIINYDGGKIDPEDPEPEPDPVEPLKASDLSHEELKDLYGGNGDGHYHLTSEELVKLASYPEYKDLTHEKLEGLLGGDEGGHYHVTEEEHSKLKKLILAFFPDGSDEVIIKPVTPDNPDDPVDPYDPYGGLPSGTAPGWELKMLPSGYEATEYAYKMYYGITPAVRTEPRLVVHMKITSSGNKAGKTTLDLSNWNAIGGFNLTSVNHVYAYYYSPVRYALYYAGDPSSTGKGGGYATMGGGGQLTATNGKINSLCYSELLNVLLTATDAGEARKVTIKTNSHSTSSAYNAHLTVNPGCAAWHPTTAVFCLTGLEGTSTSMNGETWTLNEDAPHNLLELSYREDLDCFVARSGEDKTFYASADGIEWHQLSDTPIPLETISTVHYNPENGWYCAVGLGDGNAYFSKDLKHWVPTKLRNNTPVDVADVIYMPSTGLYVAMPTSGTYYYTFDPSKWTD